MKNSMKAVILFICFSIIDLNTSGQGKYLKLAASLASSIYIIYGISEMMPIDSNSTIAFFQVFAIFLGAASVVGGIILTAVGISILANGRSYKTYGRSACSISVAYDKTTLPSSDNLASYQ